MLALFCVSVFICVHSSVCVGICVLVCVRACTCDNGDGKHPAFCTGDHSLILFASPYHLCSQATPVECSPPSSVPGGGDHSSIVLLELLSSEHELDLVALAEELKQEEGLTQEEMSRGGGTDRKQEQQGTSGFNLWLSFYCSRSRSPFQT